MKTKSDMVKVTFLSAATIITFAGATLILPKTIRAQGIRYGDTVELSSSDFKELGINYSEDNNKASALFAQKIFEKLNEKSNIISMQKRFADWYYNPEVLEYLGITSKELYEYKQKGMTVFDIADEKKLSREEIVNIYEDNFVLRLKNKLEKGKISEERYNKIMSNVYEIREKFFKI